MEAEVAALAGAEVRHYYSVAYRDLEDGWCEATILEAPHIQVQARSRAEAREMAISALMGHLRSDKSPAPLGLSGHPVGGNTDATNA